MTDGPRVPATPAAPDVTGSVAPSWVGLALLVLWGPVLVGGLAFTLTIVYAVLGVPVLALAWPSVSVGWRILRHRTYTSRRAVVGVIGAALAAVLLVVFITPFRGDGLAWLAFAGGLAWCVGAWVTSRAALRWSDPAPPDGGGRTVVRQ